MLSEYLYMVQKTKTDMQPYYGLNFFAYKSQKVVHKLDCTLLRNGQISQDVS
jgi:hypothetical protein